MTAAGLFSCRKELLRRVGEFSELVPKPYTCARASFILDTQPRASFDRIAPSVLDSSAPIGLVRGCKRSRTMGGFFMCQRVARGEPMCLLKGGK